MIYYLESHVANGGGVRALKSGMKSRTLGIEAKTGCMRG